MRNWETFLQEVFGGHFPGEVVRAGDVGNRRKTLLEVLCHSDNPVFAEQPDVVGVIELADYGIGLHAPGPLDDGFDSEFVAYRQRQAAQAPRLSRVVRIAGHAEQELPGVGFGEIRRKITRAINRFVRSVRV